MWLKTNHQNHKGLVRSRWTTEQRSPSNPITGKMAHTEFAAPKTIQGEVFTDHVWCETHQDELIKETISPEHLADCQGLLPTGAQDTTGCWEGHLGVIWNLLWQVLRRLWECVRHGIFRGWNKGEEREASRWIREEQACKNRGKRGWKGLVMCKQVGSQCSCLTEPCASSPQSNQYSG